VAGAGADGVRPDEEGAAVVDLVVSGPEGRGRLEARLEIAARAHGWTRANRREADRLWFRPVLP
jgi:hypothetical protein